jgi:hypothetical protein
VWCQARAFEFAGQITDQAMCDQAAATRPELGYAGAFGGGIDAWQTSAGDDLWFPFWAAQTGAVALAVYPIYHGPLPPAASPTPSPSPAPSPTTPATPTAWLTPTPGAGTASCAPIDWKADAPVVDFPLDPADLIVEQDCGADGLGYALLPEESFSTPDLGWLGDALGIPRYDIGWDGVAVCVTWVRFPQFAVLGLGVALDWFLLPFVAWLLKRMLNL